MKTTYRNAIKAALVEALEKDPHVFLMGEDVGEYGGSYAVSKGLLERFGPERIRDAPLSENGFVGAGIGAALGGMRPIVELMTVNFSLLALDQIVNSAATLLHMSGGQLEVPLVIRMAYGAGPQLAAQHSHSFEGWYAHVPGLRVVAPATVEDARGMLASALEERDPVVMFEHAALYNAEGELTDGVGRVPLEGARVRRPGTDVSLVTWGGCLPRCLLAAQRLQEQGISAEVLDLRSLRPLDDAALVQTVKHTHRALIVTEEWTSGSLAAELSARVMEQAFYELDAPVARLGCVEVPVPYAKHQEEAALPQVSTITEAAKEVVAHHG